MKTLSSLLLLFTLYFFALPATAAPQIGKPAPDFTATDIHGKEVTLSKLKGKIIVLEWTNPGCPFVKKHYDFGTMQALQKESVGKGVVWVSINSGAQGKQGHMTTEEALQQTEKAGIHASHYILDADGTIGHLYEAKTTPDMFVIDQQGALAYAGAIDNHATVDPADITSARNYVREAITALQAGQTPEATHTKPYGCGVKY